MLDVEEQKMVTGSVRALLAEHWTRHAAVSPTCHIELARKVHAELARDGFLSTGINVEGGLISAKIVSEETGRAACPAPIIPEIAAATALASAGLPLMPPGPLAIAIAEPGAQVGDGRITGAAQLVDDVFFADRILVRVTGGMADVSLSADGVSIEPMPILAEPPLANIKFDNVSAAFIPLGEPDLEDAALIERLLLAARAHGAAARAFELALEHVQQRKQFGQPLARFQSMQHKLADCALAFEASALMISDACNRFDASDNGWRFCANAAIAYSAAELRKVSLETHHALAQLVIPKNTRRRNIFAVFMLISYVLAVSRAPAPTLRGLCLNPMARCLLVNWAVMLSHFAANSKRGSMNIGLRATVRGRDKHRFTIVVGIWNLQENSELMVG